MALLTPGVLSKLLEHASTDVKVAGEHRTPLLQVIGIVPRGDDPLSAARLGFFLRVSDSLHAAYVSVSDEDAELVSSDRVQLGQFVYVSRLDSAAPVPVLRGLRPLPRRRPCVGEPVDLVPYDFLLQAGSSSRDGKVRKKAAAAAGDRLKSGKLSPASERISRRSSFGNGGLAGARKETRRLSLDLSSRKGWEKSPPAAKNAARNPLKSDSKLKESLSKPESSSVTVVTKKKKSLRCSLSPKLQTSGSSPVKVKSSSSLCGFSSKTSKTSPETSKGPTESSQLVKVPVNPKNWSRYISWDALPSNLESLGKDSVRQRNAAFSVATDALQEAAASQSVIRSLSVFAELSESAKQDSLQSSVEKFLTLHETLQQAADVLDVMNKMRVYETKFGTDTALQLPTVEDNSVMLNRKSSAAAWIHAALETDLSSFSLFSKKGKGILASGANQHHCIVLDPHLTQQKPRSNKNPKEHSVLTDLTGKGLTSKRIGYKNKTKSHKCEWSGGQGLKETAALAKLLLSVTRGWFLKLLEDQLDKGFGGKEGVEDIGIAGVLGQLKRVNQWLEDATGEKFEVDASVERVRKKLYKFLLEHVDSSSPGSVDGQQGN